MLHHWKVMTLIYINEQITASEIKWIISDKSYVTQLELSITSKATLYRQDVQLNAFLLKLRKFCYLKKCHVVCVRRHYIIHYAVTIDTAVPKHLIFKTCNNKLNVFYDFLLNGGHVTETIKLRESFVIWWPLSKQTTGLWAVLPANKGTFFTKYPTTT